MILLNRNELAFDLPIPVKQHILDTLLHKNWNHYPTAFASSIKTKIAAYHGVATNQVLIGNGSSEVIQHLIATHSKECPRLVYPLPGFELFKLCGDIQRLEHIPWKNNHNMTYDYANFPGKDGSIYILCNPNNPSGDLLDREFIENQISAQPNSLFILDEAYVEFSNQTLIDLADVFPNVVVVRTLSKAIGLAGIRFGYGICHSSAAQAFASMEIPYRMNHFTMEVAHYVFDNYECHLRDIVEKTNARREELFAQVSKLFQGTRNKIFPSHGNFLMMHLVHPAAYAIIEDRGVRLARVTSFPHFYRVTVGQPHEHQQLISALSAVLADDAR